MTEVEHRIWQHLRLRQILGHRFRRQHPLGPYIVDFVCLKSRLVIELDGGQHANSAQDKKRDGWLSAEGYRVLRFWNHQIFNELDAVLEAIRLSLETPPSQPSPLKGKGAQIFPSPLRGEAVRHAHRGGGVVKAQHRGVN